MKTKKTFAILRLTGVSMFALLLLAACGGGGGDDDDDDNPGGGGLNGELSGQLYYDAPADFVEFDFEDGTVTTIRSGSGDGAAPSADASEFIVIEDGDAGEEDVVIFRRNGTEVDRISFEEGLTGFPKLSTDGTFVALGRDFGGDTLVFDRAGVVQKSFGAGVDNYAWTPDGRLVLAAGDSIYLTDMSFTVGPAIRSFAAGSDPSGLAVSPDGNRIAFTISDGSSTSANSRHVWIMGIDGASPRQLTNSQLGESSPAWSPDGDYLAVLKGANNCPVVWAVPADASTQQLSSSSATVFAINRSDGNDVCAFSPPAWR